MWVGEKGRRLVTAAGARNATIKGVAATTNQNVFCASLDGGRPPARLTFVERRALDMEQQELERGLMLWPDADMVEERNRSRLDKPSGAGNNAGGIDWRSKKANAIQRKAASMLN